jgi:hypothetical protein
MKSSTVIQFSIQRLACSECGAEANASCNCGKPYVPKSVRAREAVEAHPEKSDRAIAAEIGVTHPTVAAARKEVAATGKDLPVERTGLDGKKRRKLVQQAPKDVDEEGDEAPSGQQAPKDVDEEEDVPPSDVAAICKDYVPSARKYVKLLVERNKLEDRVDQLTVMLDAKEAAASRNWPTDMAKKQIKKRDKCLENISWWQGDLERLYAEVTKQPPWRVEIFTDSGLRFGNGARLATRSEAEAYGQGALRRENKGKGKFEILPCENEEANIQIVGNTSTLSTATACCSAGTTSTPPSPPSNSSALRPFPPCPTFGECLMTDVLQCVCRRRCGSGWMRLLLPIAGQAVRWQGC